LIDRKPKQMFWNELQNEATKGATDMPWIPASKTTTHLRQINQILRRVFLVYAYVDRQCIR